MSALTPDQRNYYYINEAERVGIHKPILAALYAVQRTPALADGDTGLGVMPANQIIPINLDTFEEQVQYAANTIRTFTDNLITQGWKGTDLWDAATDRYSDKFLNFIAKGYIPQSLETSVGRIMPCNADALIKAYLADIQQDYEDETPPQKLSYLDQELLTFVERVPRYYQNLVHQRDALLETVRTWRKLDSPQAVMASLVQGTDLKVTTLADSELDLLLKHFIQRISPNYGGFPHQREALLRLVQLWRQLESRAAVITFLESSDADNDDFAVLDPVLVDFYARVGRTYEGKGSQRNALTETVRLWRKLDSRQSAIASLGIDLVKMQAATGNPQQLAAIAAQLDKELIGFAQRVPSVYKEDSDQRDALIRGVQLWREFSTQQQAIASLTDDLKRLAVEKPKDPPVVPVIIVPTRPTKWTTQNLQMQLSIIPDGSFTWLEATHGGTRMPPDQATVDAMVRIAKLAQRARDRIGRPFTVTSWYRPPIINKAVGGASQSRHMVGDAIDFVCAGMSGNQLYWLLDPWWPSGLGRYTSYPDLCHIDARNYRARWRH